MAIECKDGIPSDDFRESGPAVSAIATTGRCYVRNRTGQRLGMRLINNTSSVWLVVLVLGCGVGTHGGMLLGQDTPSPPATENGNQPTSRKWSAVNSTGQRAPNFGATRSPNPGSQQANLWRYSFTQPWFAAGAAESFGTPPYDPQTSNTQKQTRQTTTNIP